MRSATLLGWEVKPQAPWRVTQVRALPGYRLQVHFVDQSQGLVDLSERVRSPHAGVFAALADERLFAQVGIDHGAVTWPGEIDLAPDAMHDAIKTNGIWHLL